MAKKNSIKLFEDKLVRSVWDEEKEEWFFSVNDVVQILTDSTNVTDYIKKMRKRDEELGKGWGQIVTPLSVQTAGGKQKTNFANTQGLFRRACFEHAGRAFSNKYNKSKKSADFGRKCPLRPRRRKCCGSCSSRA